jgi:hypothetical protein
MREYDDLGTVKKRDGMNHLIDDPKRNAKEVFSACQAEIGRLRAENERLRAENEMLRAMIADMIHLRP